jgi:hypothetical protein
MKHVLMVLLQYLVDDDEYYPEMREPRSHKFAVLSDTHFSTNDVIRIRKYWRKVMGDTMVMKSWTTTKDERTVRREFPETWYWNELDEEIKLVLNEV